MREPILTPGGAELVRFARACVRHALGGPRAVPPEGDWARRPGATFVTVRWIDGSLQGCIGTLEARMALVDDVAKNAVAAALQDPRAEPISLEDVERLDFELSILSALQPIPFEDEASAHAAIEIGTHGIVFAYGDRRSTFLPTMWSHFDGVASFMAALKQKAGLRAELWDEDVKLWSYVVDKYVDPAPARTGKGES
jgi:AmmeMemoRadiSam system protein A